MAGLVPVGVVGDHGRVTDGAGHPGVERPDDRLQVGKGPLSSGEVLVEPPEPVVHAGLRDDLELPAEAHHLDGQSCGQGERDNRQCEFHQMSSSMTNTNDVLSSSGSSSTPSILAVIS